MFFYKNGPIIKGYAACFFTKLIPPKVYFVPNIGFSQVINLSYGPIKSKLFSKKSPIKGMGKIYISKGMLFPQNSPAMGKVSWLES